MPYTNVYPTVIPEGYHVYERKMSYKKKDGTQSIYSSYILKKNVGAPEKPNLKKLRTLINNLSEDKSKKIIEFIQNLD